jgi:hypothetical protein
MVRTTLALVVLFGAVAAASATAVPPRREPPAFWNRVPPDLVSRALAAEEKPQYHMTEQTEVKLDGKVCPYEKVPDDASIILLEVGSDQAILRLHFQSKK